MHRERVETTLNQQKRSRKAQVTVNIAGAGSVLVPQSEDRVGLLIGSHPTSLVCLSQSQTVGVGLGINLYPASLPLPISLGDMGSIVKGPIYVVDGTFPMTITYFEATNSAD